MKAGRLTIYLIILIAIGFGFLIWSAVREGDRIGRTHFEKRELVVMTYPSFSSAVGPGPKLFRIFEQRHNCKVVLVNGGDAQVMTKKLINAKEFLADSVVGLDSLSKPAADKEIAWHTPLTPIDWAPLGFLYRKSKVQNPPTSLQDLLKPEFKKQMSFQDPRTSTPGLYFLGWVFAAFEKGATDYLQKLKNQVYSVSPSWTAAYGLFQRDWVQLTLSYQTSLIYHRLEEKNTDIEFAVFSEGHPVQTEYAGVPANCKQCDLAAKWTAFLHEPESQKIIMNQNYMFPILPEVMEGSEFAKLPKLKLLPQEQLEKSPHSEQDWIHQWIAIFRP